MQSVDLAALAMLSGLGGASSLPRERKIELYSNSSQVKLYNDKSSQDSPWQRPEVAAALAAFAALETHFELLNPKLAGLGARERFLELAPKCRVERLAAQVFRILKIVRLGATAPGNRLKCEERVFQINYIGEPFSFGLRITLAGLDLLSGFTAAYLSGPLRPHSEAYQELLLNQYYEDIIAEIRYLSDEDGNVLHFRKTHDFSREFRYLCGGAKYLLQPQRIEIEIGERFADKARYPIDFFLQVEGEFYIVPCEVLGEGARLERGELLKWRIRQDFDPQYSRYDLRAQSEGRSSGPMA